MLITWQSLLAATSRRVVYIEHDMLFDTKDELTYDAVSSTELINAPVFVGMTLRTDSHKYKLSYANKQQVTNFIKVVNKHHEKNTHPKPAPIQPSAVAAVETPNPAIVVPEKSISVLPLSQLGENVRKFIEDHNFMVIIRTARSGHFDTNLATYKVTNSEIYLLSREKIPNTVINAIITDRANLAVLQIQALFEEQYKDQNGNIIYRLILTDVIE